MSAALFAVLLGSSALAGCGPAQSSGEQAADSKAPATPVAGGSPATTAGGSGAAVPTFVPTEQSPVSASQPAATAAASVAAAAEPEWSSALGLARGYLTTPLELQRVAELAEAGEEPYRSAVSDLLKYAAAQLDGKKLRAPRKMNIGGNIEKPEILADGSKQVYAWALAYNLLRDTQPDEAEEYAERAHELLMSMPQQGTHINDYENNTRLNLSVYIGNFVYAADLLSNWTPPDAKVRFAESDDAQLFKSWLGTEIVRYPYSAAFTRVNNWGAWGRLATAVIADYVGDDAPLYVQRFTSSPRGDYTLDPAFPCEPGSVDTCDEVDAATMYRQAMQLHFDMVDGRMYEFGESTCDSSGSKSMIRPDGGLPDELRREYDCDTSEIKEPYGAAARYSQFAAEAMVSQAELAWRRGDPSLYTHIDPSTERGSLYRSIQFLIDNDVTLTRGSMLEMANRFYSYQQRVERDTARRDEYDQLLSHDLPAILKDENDWPVGAGFVSFGTLTHGFAPDEKLAAPPMVPPRGYDG